MELKWLEDFIALAHHKNFSRAAEIRNVTQSGFSRRIQSLEQWVGAELIDRSSYPPALTPAGALFRETAEDVLAKLRDTRSIIQTEKKMAGGGLQIVAGHTIALNFLPEWLALLHREVGFIHTRVTPSNVHDSVLMLVNGNCELMFAYHHPELPLHLDPNRYQHLTVGLDDFIPVCVPNQQSAPRFRLPGTSQHPLPLITYTQTSYFGRCLAYLLEGAKNTAHLVQHYESDMAEVLKRMVLKGEGLAWLPKSSIETELASGRLVTAGGAAWSLQVELRVYRDTHSRNMALDRLWEHLKNRPNGAALRANGE